MKGSIGVWAVVLAMGWIITILWIIFTTITVEHFYPWAQAHITNEDSLAVLDRQIAFHNYWPILLMIGLSLYAIIRSVKREPTEGYVGM